MNVVEPDVPDDAVSETVGDVIMYAVDRMDIFVDDDNMNKDELGDEAYDLP